ncbi:MAG: hypothetical protein RDV48_04500 [Candidatus Eremiobacteraeota bacterium]|nr:hypothetical protein [Candidatus Eremiobacteraeota bacterium]
MRKEFHLMIDSLNDKELLEARKFFIEKVIPYDEEPLTAEEERAFIEGEKAIREGKGKPLSEVIKKYGVAR